jgi:ATP-binding cassette, subfamily B, bacterial
MRSTAGEASNSDWRLIRRLLGYARPYWPHIGGVLLLDLLAAPMALLLPVPFKIVFDSIIGSQPMPGPLAALLPAGADPRGTAGLLLATGLYLAIHLVTSGQTLGYWLLQTYTSERLMLDLRARLFGHAQRLSLSYHDTQGASDSAYRIMYDTACIQSVSMEGLTPFITAGATLAGMFYVTARIDVVLAVVALAVSPVLLVLAQVSRRQLRERWPKVKELDSSAMEVIQEALGALRVVKAFGREDHEHQRFLKHSRERLRGEVDLALIEGGFDVLVGLTVALGTAATLWVGALHIRSGALTLGQLYMVITYLAELYTPLQAFGKRLGELQSALTSAERMFVLLDQVPEVIERPNCRALGRARGAVEFRKVCFSYDGQRPVLSDVSFTVPAGARVGIFGRTGAGKTTLVSLLLRFYDPTLGQILLDGTDLCDYKLADLRQQFAFVLQEPVLFSSSIAENIAYARPDATREEIVATAKTADIHDFIAGLPEGYKTILGERGMTLSGGERQRVSLARAFLKNAPILVLDEPTSSVDVKTEAGILEAMERLMHGRTTFMIAHRLATLERCDVRIHLEAGRITATDTHGNMTVSSGGGAR